MTQNQSQGVMFTSFNCSLQEYKFKWLFYHFKCFRMASRAITLLLTLGHVSTTKIKIGSSEQEVKLDASLNPTLAFFKTKLADGTQLTTGAECSQRFYNQRDSIVVYLGDPLLNDEVIEVPLNFIPLLLQCILFNLSNCLP